MALDKKEAVYHKGAFFTSPGRSQRDLDGKVNLAEKLSLFSDRFAPRTVAEFNGHDIMVVKVEGEFVWHSHEDTDDVFLVLKGHLIIRMRGRDDVVLGPGELYVVPRGVEHRPVTEEETHLLLIEPTGTPTTSDAGTASPRREL
jgi:mannose-6-phosphate isomerase-like protein (cupin superfamily)